MDDDGMDEELISVEVFADDDAAEELEGEAASGLAETRCDRTMVSAIPNESQ